MPNAHLKPVAELTEAHGAVLLWKRFSPLIFLGDGRLEGSKILLELGSVELGDRLCPTHFSPLPVPTLAPEPDWRELVRALEEAASDAIVAVEEGRLGAGLKALNTTRAALLSAVGITDKEEG